MLMIYTINCPRCGKQLISIDTELVQDEVNGETVYYPRNYFDCDDCKTEYSVTQYGKEYRVSEEEAKRFYQGFKNENII